MNIFVSYETPTMNIVWVSLKSTINAIPTRKTVEKI